MFLVFLSIELGLSLNAVRMFSTSDLATYLAFYELNPPGHADNVRAARMAFYSANNFSKKVRFETLIKDFVPSSVVKKSESGEQLAQLLGGITSIPDDVAERFH